MASRKRLFDEFEDISSIDKTTKSATVHGVLANLSPMKKSKTTDNRYFDGHLTDGVTNIRLIGFDTSQQQRLADYSENQTPVKLSKCQVSNSMVEGKLQVVLKTYSSIDESPTKFSIPENMILQPGAKLDIGQIHAVQDFQKVSVAVKPIKVSAPEMVSDKSKQDVYVADATGSMRLTLWQDDINKLDVNKSYLLKNVAVRSYQKVKYLSFPKEDVTIEEVSDLGDVCDLEQETVTDPSRRELNDVEVLLVLNLQSYPACITCKAKVETTSATLGRCTKCSSMQRLNKCENQVTAKLKIESNNTQYTVQVFGNMLKNITTSFTEEGLLEASQFSCAINSSNIIVAVWH